LETAAVPLLRRLLRLLPATPPRRSSTQVRSRWRPTLEVLDDRIVPSVSSITSSFNSATINAGSTIWFNSTLKVSGLGSGPTTIRVDHSTITSPDFTLNTPNAAVTFDPSATQATTTFDGATNTWVTTVPVSSSGSGGLLGGLLGGLTGLLNLTPPPGNTFLDGATLYAPTGLRGGISPVTWSANFTTDTSGVSVTWQWEAGVYSQFSNNLSVLGVKPVDSNSTSQYRNSDLAGTPENFKQFLVAGARGNGGSNYTGTASGTKTVSPERADPPAAQTASLSGYIYVDFDQNGMHDAGEDGVAGVTVTLTGTDVNGNSVSLTAVTDDNGYYSFLGLAAGTYQLSKPRATDQYRDFTASPGTVNGSSDGTAQDQETIVGIHLNAGDNGIDFNFGEVVPN
jgi:hypothetical protein